MSLLPVRAARCWSVLSGLLIALSVSCGGKPPAPAQGRVRPRLAQVRVLPDTMWAQYRLTTSVRDIDAYVIRDEQPKPTVVLLQGSGCLPLFTVDYAGGFHATSIFEDVVRARSQQFHFVLVEKQGVTPLVFPQNMTLEQQRARFKAVADGDCTSNYFAHETKTRRVEDAEAVVDALTDEAWVRGVLVAGHSEGSDVAAGLLRVDQERHVIAAGLLTGAGPTQFFSGDETRDSFARHVSDLLAMRDAPEDQMWEGHAARRWKSYAIDSSPLDDVRDSPTPIYVAHGGREPNLRSADVFVLEALRQQPRRPLRYVVVADGDHGFTTRDGRDHFLQVFDDFTSWATTPHPPTAVGVLK